MTEREGQGQRKIEGEPEEGYQLKCVNHKPGTQNFVADN